MNLTPKQLRIFEYIREFRERNRFSPTLEEIARAFGVSKITVLQHLRALEKRGAIRRARYQARSIEIREPEERLAGARKVPVVGTLTGGEPIGALSETEFLDVSRFLPGSEKGFLLRVGGDSMRREQLRDGDYIICEHRDAARDGETVVAVLPNDVATLGMVYRDGDGRLRLRPTNQHANPLHLEQLQIRGVVIGVLRRY